MNDQLTRTLTEKAERFAQQHSTDLSVDSVLARAGEIRRGRRMRATMAMAAVVLAVAVPVGITVANQGNEGKEPVPSPPGDHSEIRLGDLVTGAMPEEGYAEGSRIRHAGANIMLDGSPVSALARIDGGYLVAQTNGDTGETTVRFVDDEGKDGAQTWRADSPIFAVSPKGEVGAFVESDGTVVAVEDAGSRWYELGKVPGGQPASVMGENCSGRSEEEGCRIYVARSDESGPATYVVTPHSEQPLGPMSEIRKVADITEDGTVAGITQVSDTGTCSQVRDAENVQLWSTCDHRLLSFSPDGKHLLASAAYADGFGDTQVAILNAKDGTPVLELGTAQGAAITQMQWDDDEHVLLTVFQKNQWAIIRVALNGDREYAVQPVAGTDFEQGLLQPVR